MPTKLDVPGPLKYRPPSGKTLVFTQCEVDQCHTESIGLAAAAKALGWHYKVINFQSDNPATLVAAMNQALQYHPVAVATTGISESLWSSVLPAYTKAKVPILTFAVAPLPPTDVLTDQESPADDYHFGEMLANWFIADSKGKGHALLVTVNEFTILESVNAGFEDTVKKNCPGCKVTTMNESIAQAESSGLVTAVVAALRKDSSIGYAVAVDGPFFTGLSAALAAAGLSHRVQIASSGGDTGNLTNIKTGTEAATTGVAFQIGVWLEVDTLLRHIEGMPTGSESTTNMPTQLILHGSNFAIDTSYPQPADYETVLEKLWKVS